MLRVCLLLLFFLSVGPVWALSVKSLSITDAAGKPLAHVRVEMAVSQPERELGLMNRDNVPAGTGMFFVWDAPKRIVMWMKNTRVPLDMIFTKNNVVVATIAWARPYDLTPLDPGVDADGVLELAGGQAAALGISVGARLAWGH